MSVKMFWIFGVLQSLSLAVIIFIMFYALNSIKGEILIGWDTQLVLMITFPLFLLLTEYTIFSKIK